MPRISAGPIGKDKELAALRQSEEKFRKLFENSLQGLVIIQNAHIVFFNNAYTALTGYSGRELLSLPDPIELIHPDDRELVLKCYHNRLKGKRVPSTYECRITRKDGSMRWLETHASLISYEGKPAVQIAYIDITERKRAEIALQESERRFFTVFKKNPLSIAITRLSDGCCVEANDAFQKMTGFSREEIIGRTPADLNLWVDLNQRNRLIKQARKKTVSGSEMQIRRKSGEIAHVLFSLEKIELGGEFCMLSIMQDITERKNMEDALRQRIDLQDQLAKITATVPGMIYSLQQKPDGSLCLPYCSSMMSEIFGSKTEEVRSDFRKGLALIDPDDLEHFQDSIAASARNLSPWHGKFKVRHPEKGEIWIEGYALPSRESDGSILWHGFAYDVSDRQHAQEQLHRFVVASPVVLYALQIVGNKPQLAWMSENVRRITGWDPADAKQDDWWTDNIYEEDRAGVFAAQALPSDENHLIVEYRFRRRDGTYMWIRDEKRLLRNFEDKPVEVVGSWVDISEQRHLEAQLQQAQKMEAIGVLAGGVAHDFNNLLTIINGYAEITARGLDSRDRRRRNLEQIRKAGQQAASLTSQLLAFSRKQMLQPKILNLNDVLDDTNKMLRRLIGEDIELVVITQSGLGLTYADPAQMQQIIMNIVVNARDAMPKGGKLTIETGNVILDEKYVQKRPVEMQPGRYIMLAISDNGIGMDAVTQSHIFEPFFTTKEKGKGTGLGLSTVYGIVKQSNGYIWVYSEPGKGTTFKIYLPRAVEEIAEPIAEKKLEYGLRGFETLLLVEDDQSVRGLSSQILSELGYTIIEASNGMEALDIIQKHPEEIHLVFTDLIMPGMSGNELVAQLKLSRPGIKVLYASGYTSSAIIQHGIMDSEVAFLQKPFTADNLARKIREILNS
jgi:two-component system, cell cycle sensor histidine kinase and response regulator CckA